MEQTKTKIDENHSRDESSLEEVHRIVRESIQRNYEESQEDSKFYFDHQSYSFAK